jgi:hypothetical protein
MDLVESIPMEATKDGSKVNQFQHVILEEELSSSKLSPKRL